MKVLKLMAPMLVLGVIACSLKANASGLPSITKQRPKSRLDLVQLNTKDTYLAYSYYNRGVDHLLSGDYQKAIVDFTKAIEINPKYAKAYNNRGVARGFLEDYQGAIVDFTKAIEINLKYVTAYYNRGIAHYQLKDYQRAITDLQKAAKLYQKQGREAEAQEAFEIIKEIRSL